MTHDPNPSTDLSVLVVEDEPDLAELLRVNLLQEGYRCDVLHRGDVVMQQVRNHAPNVIVLDRMLPGRSGDRVLEQLKRNNATTHIPVILLTAKSEESDELVGFALGADDYITKPFSTKVLLARIDAALRRAQPADPRPQDETIAHGPVRMIPARHEAWAFDEPIRLTATEYRLLQTLLAAPKRVLSRNQLIDALFGQTAAVTDRAIDVHITALRKKLTTAAPWVQTVRGVGYTFREPE